jgi:hypothetical protein
MPSIHLSSHGLDRAASANKNDFTFVFNGFDGQCTLFRASLITTSPSSATTGQDHQFTFARMDCEGIDWKRLCGLPKELLKGFSIVPSQSDLRGLMDIGQVRVGASRPLCVSVSRNIIHVIVRSKRMPVVPLRISSPGFRDGSTGRERTRFVDPAEKYEFTVPPSEGEDSRLECIGRVNGAQPVLLRHVRSE